jgi:hypothetical protein
MASTVEIREISSPRIGPTFGQNALLRFFANSGISRLAQLSWLNVSLDFSAMLLEVMQQYLFGVVRFVAVFAVP